ncbi:MAG: hypothetical protein PHU14_08640 [Methylovulum sp.]|nr:hypothetical protein [Methylovulum sp.]
MKFLTYDAARLFLNSSKEAYLFGLISWSQLMDRFVTLKGMSSSTNPANITISRILQIEEWQNEDNWEYEGESLSNRSQDDNKSSSSDSSLEYLPGDENEDGVFLYFLAGTHTGLSNWEFHQYDDDFFPSIPHGHWNGQSQPKLDPYQGWVYKGSKQQRREPKKNIIALWNDRKFREFTQIAIDYYLTHHQDYHGWRVKNPKRLPRRR